MFDSLAPVLQKAEDAVGALDVDVLVGTQPAELVDLLIRHDRAIAAVKMKAIARAEEMNQWHAAGYRTYEDWLAAKSGTSKTQARRQAKTAKNLADQDDVADALAAGEISEDQAEMVADAAEKNPSARKELLDTAKNKNKSHRDLCDEAGKAKAAAESDRARRKRLRDGQRASWGGDRDGFWASRCQHDPEIGAALGAVLDAEVDRLIRKSRQEGLRLPFARLRADAYATLILGRDPYADLGSDADTDSSSSPGPHPSADSAASTRPAGPCPDSPPSPDAADGTAGESASAPAAAVPDDTGGDRSRTASDLRLPDVGDTDDGSARSVTKIHKQLIIDVNLETLRRGCVHPGETCYLRGVGQVPVEIARQWVDDAFVKAVIRDGGDVKAVAHYGRHVPARVRTALGLVDHTCAVPGCSNSRMELDHDQTFNDLGPASVDNLRPLCVHHHRQRTHDGYELKGPPGDRTWHAPDGRVLFADHPKRRIPNINPDP